jgi:hypothetical protein
MFASDVNGFCQTPLGAPLFESFFALASTASPRVLMKIYTQITGANMAEFFLPKVSDQAGRDS